MRRFQDDEAAAPTTGLMLAAAPTTGLMLAAAG
jgi:hypothetical protein